MSEKPSLGAKSATLMPQMVMKMQIVDCRFAEIRENKSEKTKDEYPWRVQLCSYATNLDLISAVEPDLTKMYKCASVLMKQTDQVSSFDNNHRAVKMFAPVGLLSLSDNY